MIAQQVLNGLVLGGVYALFALGFTLIFGIHRIMNMAHGAMFAKYYWYRLPMQCRMVGCLGG